jgi:hypothetical protein
MSANTGTETLEKRLADWTLQGEELRTAIRQGRIQELSADGERVLVRPIMVQHPHKDGPCDQWFGLTYWDWKRLREEGFDGFMETTENSGRPKIMILVESAVQFMQERCRRQAAARRMRPRHRKKSLTQT